MNRKSYYLIIFLTALIGLALSFLVIPSFEEVSLMLYYDRQFNESYERYQKLYDEGNRSLSVVSTLARLKLEKAEEKEAIELMEEYVKTHPESKAAQVYLGKLYDDTDLFYHYLYNLENLEARQSDFNRLREMEVLYNSYADTEKQRLTLERIIQYPQALPEDYYKLTYLYADRAQMQEAEQTLNALFARFNIQKIDPAILSFAIGFFINQERAQRGLKIAQDYVDAMPDRYNSIDFIYLFVNKGKFDEALQYYNTLSPLLQQTNEGFIAYVNLLFAEKKYAQTYELLKERYLQGNLPSVLNSELLTLSLDFNDFSLLTTLVQDLPEQSFHELFLEQLIEKSILYNQLSLLASVKEKIANTQAAKDPFLQLLLAIGLNQQQDFKRLYQPQRLSDPQRAVLAELFYLKQEKELAKQLLKEINSFKEIDSGRLYEISALYIALGEIDQGERLLQQLHKELDNFPKTAFQAALLFDAARGKTAKILSYLYQAQNWHDLYYAAYQYKQTELALELAKRIVAQENSIENAALLADAYLQAGQLQESIDLYRRLKPFYPSARSNYLYALSLAAKQDPFYRPFLREEIYEQTRLYPLRESEMRNFAYLLLENLFKKESEDFFFVLANHKNFKSEDVQALLNLWGEKPSDKQIAWIKQKTLAAQVDEKALWLKYLSDIQLHRILVEVVNDEDLQKVAIFDLYLDALVTLKRYEAIKSLLIASLDRENEPKRLKKLGKIALDTDLESVAESYYVKANTKDPFDADPYRALGGIYFNQGRLSFAKTYLQQYFLLSSDDDYSSLNIYANLLKNDHESLAAEAYFERALDVLQNLPNQDDYTKLAEAQLYHSLREDTIALDIYQELITKNPNFINLHADFATFLMDIDFLYYASWILFEDFIAPKDATAKQTLKAQINLELARVRLLKEFNEFKAALCYLAKLQAIYPDAPEVYSSAADLEFRMHRWQRGIAFLDAAEELDPQNENYALAKKAGFLEYRPYASWTYEYRQTALFQKENFNRIQATQWLKPDWQFYLYGEMDFIRLNSFTTTSGAVKPFKGYRERAEFQLTRHSFSGDLWRSSLYAHGGGLGVNSNYTFWDTRGFWNFSADYHKPEWGFIETTIEYGTRDALRIFRHLEPRTRLIIDFGASIRRYNLAKLPNVARTFALEGLISYQFDSRNVVRQFLGENSFFSVNYNLDAEYRDRLVRKRNSLGEYFYPLPFVSREDHTVFMSVGKRPYPMFGWEGFLGYLYNPRGGLKIVPTYGLAAIFGRPDAVWGRIDYSRTQSNEFTASTVDRYILEVRFVF